MPNYIFYQSNANAMGLCIPESIGKVIFDIIIIYNWEEAIPGVIYCYTGIVSSVDSVFAVVVPVC